MFFRLKRLQIAGHPILHSVDITFCDDSMKVSSIYTTGIIGPNGTGKSNLMGAIAAVFSEIRNWRDTGDTTRRFSFAVEYDNMGDTYYVSNMRTMNSLDFLGRTTMDGGPFCAKKNGDEISLKEIALPQRVIASTMTVTDKFLAKSDDFYRYKGIRNERSASTTGTRTIIRKTVDSLMDSMSSKATFQEELRILLKNLGLEEHLYVSYGLRYKELFLKPEMTSDGIRSVFDNWQNSFQNRVTPPWGFNNYIRHLRDNEEALDAAARFLSERATRMGDNASVAWYDLMKNAWEFQQDAFALKTLAQLDLLTYPSIDVVKKGMAFRFENSSSGESHLLCQFIGIMADIRHGSLILIDEPENSSHPDWQMNYVKWLKEIFKEYRDCHFIIATHSPMILANMKASESTIVRLVRNDDNKIVDEGGMAHGCYSWTVDEILQEVMNMKSVRTEEFNVAMFHFEKALDEEDREKAEKAYKHLVRLVRPGDELAELLRIQMIGLKN